MIKAYILIGIEGVEVNKIAKQVTDIEEVETVNIIHGEHDLIALVRAKTLIELKEIVVEKIKGINGIVMTEELIIADEVKKKSKIDKA